MNSTENESFRKMRNQHVLAQSVVNILRNIIAVLDKNPWKLIVRLGITALFVVIVNKHVDVQEGIKLLEKVDTFTLGAVFLCGIFSMLCQVLRWQLILQFHDLPSDFAVACKTMFRGFLLAFVTPGRVGELFRAIDLDPSRKMDTVLAVFEERFFAVLITILAGAAALLFQMIILGKEPFFPLFAAVILLMVLTGSLFLLLRLNLLTVTRAQPILRRLAWFPAYLSKLRALPFPKISFYTLLAHGMLLLQTALLFRMFGLFPTGEGFLAAAQAYSFMLLLPFFIANIGLREYSFALFLSPFMHQSISATLPTVALGSATVILFCNIMLPAAGGLIWMYAGRKKISLPRTTAD